MICPRSGDGLAGRPSVVFRDGMDDKELVSFMQESFPGIALLEADGNLFIYYSPSGEIPEKTFPFVTLMRGDSYDSVSDLNRPGVYRLSIGLKKATYESLLGKAPAAPGESGVVDTGHDFTALDEIMPHPIYGNLHWIGVLCPGEKTLETVKTLLAEAYEAAVQKAGSARSSTKSG